jgi:3-carboxy-cis,cis-muconate cycloisomerase
MLRFERRWRSEPRRLIPKKGADHRRGAAIRALRSASLAERARRTATLTVPVVKALTAEVAKRDAEAAAYVHWGATSQDVLDTAMVLQLGEALPPLLKDSTRIVAAFAGSREAPRHADARPHAAAAGDAAGARPEDRRLGVGHRPRRAPARGELRETQVVQFGGASGSLSALGDKAEPVMRLLAKRLSSRCRPRPWFTQRVRVAALAQDAALVVGALAKAARDISLIDADRGRRSGRALGPGRGGSSTMPHKRNPGRRRARPVGRRPRADAGRLNVAALPQEHERALGGWQPNGRPLRR